MFPESMQLGCIVFSSNVEGQACDEQIKTALAKSGATLENLPATARDRLALAPHSDQGSCMTTFRILHVDDEPDIRQVVETSLGLDPDLMTRSCASGAEALAVASDWTPDIILLDVMMPVIDGATTLARLCENSRTAGIPVVFMTARVQSCELDLFRSLGVVGVIPKPFDPMMLAVSVRAHIEPPDTRFDGLKDAFLIRVAGDLSALARHWSALEDGTDVLASLAVIGSIAHGLAGAGGIFGFDEIADAAAALEEAVTLKRDGSGTLEEVGSALGRVQTSAETRAAYRITADGHTGWSTHDRRR
jgi:CheY-like chemotaxis protein